MKKVFVVLALVFIFAFPVQTHASGIIGGAAVSGTLAALMANDWVIEAEQIVQWAQQAKDMLEQIGHMKTAAERYKRNLLAIMDVKSFQDFMKWYNRNLYIEQEAERIYNGMGVKIGGKNYSLSEIDEIPDALLNAITDPHWDDSPEEVNYRIWKTFGLSPSNYFYLKTWQQRNEDIKKRFISAREMHGKEFDEAVERNNAVLGFYSDPDRDEEDLDANKIAMNAHSTQMQIEMVLRDLSLSLDDLKDYIASRDEENRYIPNPSMPEKSWNDDPFRPITKGKAETKFKD